MSKLLVNRPSTKRHLILLSPHAILLQNELASTYTDPVMWLYEEVCGGAAWHREAEAAAHTVLQVYDTDETSPAGKEPRHIHEGSRRVDLQALAAT